MTEPLKPCLNCGGEGKLTPYIDKWDGQQYGYTWNVKPAERGRMYAPVRPQQLTTGM